MSRAAGAPDDAAPTAVLCWKQNPYPPYDHCDRRQHSKQSRCSWDVINELDAVATLNRPRPQPRTTRTKGHQP